MSGLVYFREKEDFKDESTSGQNLKLKNKWPRLEYALLVECGVLTYLEK